MHDLLASPGVAGDNRTSVVASPYQCELSDGAVDERPGHDAVAGKEWRVSGREDYEAPAVEECLVGFLRATDLAADEGLAPAARIGE